MAEGLYKIVFKGEIGLDFDEDEVKANLRRECGFDPKTVERLFSGGVFILKKDLEQATANRYRESLHRLGALCEVMPMAPPPPVFPEPPPEAPTAAAAPQSPAAETFRCPACGQAQGAGEVCLACGIVFAKYHKNQQRHASGGGEGRSMAGRPSVPMQPEIREWLLPSGVTLVGMVVLQLLLKRDLMVLGLLLLPFIFLVYLLARALKDGRSFFVVAADSIEWETSEQTKAGRNWRDYPWLSWGLIVLQIGLYYAVAARLDPERLAGTFAFLPADGGTALITLTLFGSQLLHANGWQLWGSVAFLWIAASTVEKQLGWVRLLAAYFGFGLLASLVALIAHRGLLDTTMHAVGSSGAVAGLLGLLLAAGRGRSFSFSLPFYGWLEMAMPMTFMLRVAPPLLVGAFFYCNLSNVASQEAPVLALLVGQLGHLAAFAAGTLAGLLVKSPLPDRP